METSTRQYSRILYAGLVFLIVLLLIVIGYLGNMLFGYDLAWVHARRSAPAGMAPGGTREAVTDVVIETGDVRTEALSHDSDASIILSVPHAVEGVIPCICLHYGPEIEVRDHYSGPVTHRAVVSAVGVTFYLNLADAASGGN